MKVEETIIPISTGNIAAKSWGNPDNYPILALHGWLDNANSFDFIAPFFDDYYVVAIDLPGHGLSAHRPEGAYFHISDYAAEIIAVTDKLGWKKFGILGHSLGVIKAYSKNLK